MTFWQSLIGMFKGPDGYFSSSKIMSFCGFFAFIIVSCILLYINPAKFNYEIFACLSAGGAAGLRAMDKYTNMLGAKSKVGNNGNS